MSFLLAFLSGASLKKGTGWLRDKSLHPVPTLWEPVCGSWMPVMGDAEE